MEAEAQSLLEKFLNESDTEAEAESPLWKAAQAMASLTSNFTPDQIKAANLSHLTEAQITSLTTTAAAHVAAVEASNLFVEATKATVKPVKDFINEKNTAEQFGLDYSKLKEGQNDIESAEVEQAKKAWELALKKADAAKDVANKAMDVANNSVGAVDDAIAKADQAELDNAKVVLKADLSAEVARTVRMFGCGLFQDRTLPNKNFSCEYRSGCYSILSKFIVSLKETTHLDLLVSKKEEILEKITDLEGYGFYAEWLTVVRQNLNVMVDIQGVDNLKKTLQDLIAKTSETIDELQSDVDGYSSVVDQLTSYSNEMQNSLQTHFNINPPNLPVNNNA